MSEDKKVVSIPELLKKTKELKEAAKPPVEAHDPRESMTPEEIQEYMRQEEEELLAGLGKFLAVLPSPDTSSLKEEEEELFSYNPDSEVVTQYIGEGVVMRDNEGKVSEVKDPKVIEAVKKSAGYGGPTTDTPTPVKEVEEIKEAPPVVDYRKEYQDMITDRFVSKAIANLVERLNETAIQTEKTIIDSKLGNGIADGLAHDTWNLIRAKKFEAQAVIAGGKVHYDKIPVWVKPFVDDYVRNALNTMIDFVERDI